MGWALWVFRAYGPLQTLDVKSQVSFPSWQHSLCVSAHRLWKVNDMSSQGQGNHQKLASGLADAALPVCLSRLWILNCLFLLQ